MINDKQLKFLINFTLYFVVLAVVCIIGITGVFAYTYETVGMVTDKTQIQVEVNYTAQPLSVAVNQHVQLSGVYSIDIFVSNINYSPDYVYQFEIYTPYVILTGANAATVVDQSGATFKSCRVLSTQFTNEYPQLTFKCDSNTNITSLYIRYYNSSNGYLFEGSKNWYWNYAHFRRRTADTNDNTGEITDAIGQNTQDIINNNNQNTQEIIDNQNDNTDRIIEENKKNFETTVPCPNLLSLSSFNIYTNIESNLGTNVSSVNSMATNYIKILPSTLYYISYDTILSQSTIRYAFYTSDHIFISRPSNNNTSFTFTSPSNAEYIRLVYSGVSGNYNLTELQDSLSKFMFSTESLTYCEYGSTTTQNILEVQEKTSKGILGKLGDLITGLFDTSGPDTDSLDDVAGWLPAGPVDSILTLPLSLINAILNGLGSSCTPLQVPLPFVSTTLTLPCINTLFSQINGVSTLYTWFGPIASAFILYYYFRSLYKWIDQKLSLKEDSEWGGV